MSDRPPTYTTLIFKLVRSNDPKRWEAAKRINTECGHTLRLLQAVEDYSIGRINIDALLATAAEVRASA